MSDESEIEQARMRKIADEATKPMKQRGDEFAFELFTFDDEGVGYLDEDDEHPICVLINADQLHGVRMSVSDALGLGEALAGVARQYLFDNDLGPLSKERARAERAEGLFKSADVEINRLKVQLERTLIELEDAKRAVFEK